LYVAAIQVDSTRLGHYGEVDSTRLGHCSE